MNIYRLYIDGAVDKNPGGEASFGYVLYLNEMRINEGYGVIGSGANMNNVMAECYALSQGLSSFMRHWDRRGALYIYSDSQYVVGALIQEKNYVPFKIVLSQLREINKIIPIKILWISRDKNVEADLLAKRLRNNFLFLPKA